MAFRDVGSGDVLVLVHGITGSMRNWALVAPALASRLRAVSYDQRGHGLTSSPTPPDVYTLDLLADDVRRLVDHLGVERFTLVGHSMGSMVAQTFVLSHPERVDRLVLVGATAGPLDDGEREVLGEAAKTTPQSLVSAGAEARQEIKDIGGGKLIASVRHADGNVIGLSQSP